MQDKQEKEEDKEEVVHHVQKVIYHVQEAWLSNKMISGKK